MFVSTKKAFQGQNVGGPRMRSNFHLIDRAAVYGPAEVRKARARAEALAKAQGEPLTNAEALELISKHRELEVLSKK
jgi:hypothetical protein